MTFSGANIYSGETTVREGTLSVTGLITHAGANMIVGSISGDNATLEISNTAAVSALSVILANLAGSTGTLNLNGGTLTTSQVSEGAGNGLVNFNGGTLQLSGDQANLFNSFEADNVTLAAGGGIIDTQAFTVATAHTISGAGGLTKQGSGTLTLSGANTYSGATTVTDGILKLGANATIADASSVVVNGGTLDLQTFNDTVAGLSLQSGTIDFSGATLLEDQI